MLLSLPSLLQLKSPQHFELLANSSFIKPSPLMVPMTPRVPSQFWIPSFLSPFLVVPNAFVAKM